MDSAFIFCTSYFENEITFENRYRRWLRHHAKVFPKVPLFLIDDGSPYAFVEPGITINTEANELVLGTTATMFKFPNRLGRPALLNYPGWFRSFAFAAVIARQLDFKKIVHIESDAFILSQRAADYIRGINSGWTAFWYPKESFPETSIQIICKDQFAAFEKLRLLNYPTYANKLIEELLPFTHVEKVLHGSRYTRSRIPSYAGFAVDVNDRMSFISNFG